MRLRTTIICAMTLGYLATGCGQSGLPNTPTPPPNTTITDDTTTDTDSGALLNSAANTPDSTPDPKPEVKTATLTHKTYAASDTAILNPERGYYYWTDLLESNFANTRDLGYSLIYARVLLKDYVNKPLDDVLLQKLETAFQNVRQAGIKCILRFTYSDSQVGITDAPLAVILQHIAQLKPVLGANADVIYTLQAGFIGSWGEWHTSTNGHDINADARKQILNAILDALPASRHIQVRTPLFKDSYVSSKDSDAARVGHHNDCFLASATDFGTYPDTEIDIWKNSVAADGPTTPVGGETCFLNAPRSSCETALKELSALHYSFLNGSPFGGVKEAWESEGCADEIGRRLGYRFVLNDAEFNDHVRPGTALHVKLNLKNDGYAPLYNARDAYLILAGATTYSAKVAIDWTLLQPGQTHSIETNITLPAEIAAGTYTLSLWLPDAAATLKNNPHYDILLANADGNLLSDNIVVSKDADIYSAPP